MNRAGQLYEKQGSSREFKAAMADAASALSYAQVEIPIAFVSHIKDGRTVRVEEYLNPADALDAAGIEG